MVMILRQNVTQERSNEVQGMRIFSSCRAEFASSSFEARHYRPELQPAICDLRVWRLLRCGKARCPQFFRYWVCDECQLVTEKWFPSV
jgi:hypothetical protein